LNGKAEDDKPLLDILTDSFSMTPAHRRTKTTATPKRRTSHFSVYDYPFYFMHAIITRNNRNIGEALKGLKAQELTPAVWRILALLQEQDGVTIGELAEQSLIERTLLSRILQGMERRGLICRQTDHTDKRRSVIYIETKGIELFEKILPIGRKQIERGIRGLSPNKLNQFMDMLRLVLGNVDKLGNGM
jgi:DNA-binding MarR family transcriptional regulator